MSAPTDWKSLAGEAAMDLEECPVEGCTNLPRHRGRHNKRGLLPKTRDELDKAVKKKRGGPVQAASLPNPILDAIPDEPEQAIKPREPEPEQAEPNQPEPLADGRWVTLTGRRVEAFYGVGSNTRGRGQVIAYCEAPQVLIQYEDGRKEWWREDLTRNVTCPTCNGTGMTP